MGVLTRTQMEAHVKLRIGNRADMDAFVTDAVKMSYDTIVTTMLVPENQETASMLTTAGFPTYTLPTDFVYIVSARNSSEESPMLQLGPKKYDEIKDISATDAPTHYLWWRNQLTLFPTPDDVYLIQLRYTKRLPALTAVDSVTALPREWDEVVIQGGFYRMLAWLDQGDASMKEEMRYKNMASAIVNRLGLGRIDTLDSAVPQIGQPTAWRQR